MRNSLRKGFTLVELMTAVSVFAVVMVISMGSILGVFDSNRRVQAEGAVMNNLNLALDQMTREMRFGTNYHCDISTGALTDPQNCPSGATSIAFRDNAGVSTEYRVNASRIERFTATDPEWTPVTAPEIVIESLSFYVLGAGAPPANTLQPKVLVKVKGYSGTKASTRVDFSLQTLVSQRQLDNGL